MRKRLGEHGFAVETVLTARDLLEHVGHSRPDLVILGDGLDDLGHRLLGALIQESSPGTRIIRVFSGNAWGSADEPGPADNVLCSVKKRAPADDLLCVITRVLSCSPRGSQATRSPLVVCLDDDAVFLRALARIIRRQGYRVLSYSDPELALEELPLVKPNLMILDVLMPGLNGFEVLEEIRQFYPGRISVILLSGQDGDARIAEGRRRGAAGYLTKPCAPDALLDTIRRLLANPEFVADARAVGKLSSNTRLGLS